MENIDKIAFADVQGFRAQNGRFICKEICVISGEKTYHAIVQSPFSFEKLRPIYKRQAISRTKFYHGLTFECGDTNIIQAVQETYMMMLNKKVFVKNREKLNWMRYIFRSCPPIEYVDIETLQLDLNSKNYDDFDICEYHNDVFGWKEGPCSLSNVLKLQDLIRKNEVEWE